MSPRYKPTTYLWEWDAPDTFCGADFSTSATAVHADPAAVRGGPPMQHSRHEMSHENGGKTDVPELLGTEPAPERKARVLSSRLPMAPSPRTSGAVSFDLPALTGGSATENRSSRAGSLARSRRAARQTLRQLKSSIEDEQRQSAKMRATIETTLRWRPHDPQWTHDAAGMPFRGKATA